MVDVSANKAILKRGSLPLEAISNKTIAAILEISMLIAAVAGKAASVNNQVKSTNLPTKKIAPLVIKTTIATRLLAFMNEALDQNELKVASGGPRVGLEDEAEFKCDLR